MYKNFRTVWEVISSVEYFQIFCNINKVTAVEGLKNVRIFVWNFIFSKKYDSVIVTNTLVCNVNFTVVLKILYVVSFWKFFFKICFLHFIVYFTDIWFIFFYSWFISFIFKPGSFHYFQYYCQCAVLCWHKTKIF